MSSLVFENDEIESFVLLDDCTSSAENKTSRLYTRWRKTLICESASDLDRVLAEMQTNALNGLHAVGYFTYELGAEMVGVSSRESARPFAEIFLFEHCVRLTTDQVSTWLDRKCHSNQTPAWLSAAPTAGVLDVRPSIDDQTFLDAMSRIHRYLESGDTYQVNYTYRLALSVYGEPCMLYRRLRERQPVPYGALLALPDGRSVLSFSPELFLRHDRGALTARPMKGTAPANPDSVANLCPGHWMTSDPKSIAENVMIVDLLRNDLGRVAALGTVSVPHLFKVSRYGNVLQMTSTVTAVLKGGVTLNEIFEAVYPCGSITGAPKRRTMQIIRELEQDTRGIYTGAIGWFDTPAPRQAVGDFCMSVPIRTIELQSVGNDGLRFGTMGIGAGIVYDSIAADEAQECRLKGEFLTGLPHQFDLLETMYRSSGREIRHLNIHLARLRRSASTFGFTFDEVRLIDLLRQTCDALPAEAHRIRVSLAPDGTCNVQARLLEPLSSTVRFLVATQPIPYGGMLAAHKTSWRLHYDQAVRYAEENGAFDLLFYNNKGQVTEGGRSNVFVRIGGRWLTPPLALGILPGVMRSVLLNDPHWDACEELLTIDDLHRAESIVLCNALRGPLSAEVIPEKRTWR